MAKRRTRRLHLLVGTKKGAFLLQSDLKRKTWSLRGPLLKGAEVNDIMLDTRSTPTLYACATSYWWGSNVHASKDWGKTWVPAKEGIHFPESSGKKVARVWCVVPGRRGDNGLLYAGVDPGSLFTSADAGKSWKEVEGLNNHPTRGKWTPGAGGMMVHSICLDPSDSLKMYVGISAAGVFATEDGGKTWQPRNKGVLAEFMPDKYPAVGQCVHHLELHPAKPGVLYQQNHCGVYRSDNEGRTWTDISKGLPSRFGFPIQIHPEDPDTIYVIPEQGAEFRCVANNEFTVFRSRTRGRTWEKLTRGLPRKNAFLHVHRQAMKVDTCEPAGIYVGTSSGQIFYSRDEGRSWQMLIDNLPMIYSLSTAVN